MIVDALTEHILLSFLRSALDKKETTTWEIAKNFDKGNHKNINSQNMVIKRRIESLAKDGIIIIDKEGKESIYTLDVNKVEVITYKNKNALYIKRRDGKFVIAEI